ncbi:PfkB family carbohydrate kinase [Actinacidiphila epipremni]|uniref:Bifunctional heptose 7-phosphate kinase/heptose 1-phosphate adenyltransferase n=1 Tax=Actinacidiphila epipremni TaxID=2053013 RepID=A0ABX0ZW49_9ACTN|nr:PfkB family carbohydrate kinase [Actinacidiphila epipremni]NJP45826.1 bifunctional heptose 7-phosphate kinase/heptose 1-phosphate adenyltransferase [Actinacidiphila epipremni]
MSRPLVVVGDALLDQDLGGRSERLAPDAPVPVVEDLQRTHRPGGAALAACLAAADGRDVTLVTALGGDEASGVLRELLGGRVRLVELPLDGALSRKTRVLAGGRPLVRLDDGDGRAAEPGRAQAAAVAALDSACAVLVADYGRGTADRLRDALARTAAGRPLVWDPHPRGGPPVAGTALATPSAAEARDFAAKLRTEAGEAEDTAGTRRASEDARALVHAWRTGSVAVTVGERGALLSHGAEPLLVPAPWRADGDPCGAGDRFAAAATGLLADGALPEAAVQGAVWAATRYVDDGGAAALRLAGAAAPPRPAQPVDARELAERVRARGGTVVAAGGCFDLLHAGHVALLENARRAGDCLVVCLNSDASVARRKGPTRPLVPAADRARVLSALGCVDAVAVFDEDAPDNLLRALRPDIWAKGSDYGLADLPEAALVESWGGRVMLFPYLDGRSTTGLTARAAQATSP